MSKYILTVGSPGNGFAFFGPFDSLDQAGIFGEGQYPEETFWVTELQDPAEWIAMSLPPRIVVLPDGRKFDATARRLLDE
jgi:hypothetical protein